MQQLASEEEFPGHLRSEVRRRKAKAKAAAATCLLNDMIK
jgi:hypothetical protein